MPPTPTPPLRPESNPALTGDWDGYFAARRAATASLASERDALTGEMAELNAQARLTDADAARYLDLETRARTLQTNIDTTMPRHLSASGEFEPGDLDGFVRERGIQSIQLGASSQGRPVPSDAEAGAMFDQQMADMSPAQRQAYMRRAEADYRAQRPTDVAEQDLRQRVPGPAGAVAAAALGAGVISLTPGGRLPWRRAAAPSSDPGGRQCPTCIPGAGGAGRSDAPRPDATRIARQEDAPPEARQPGGWAFRGDSRPAREVVAGEGFAGRDPGNAVPLTEHMRPRRPGSDWWSASQDPGVATQYAHNPWPLGAAGRSYVQDGGYVYAFRDGGGVLVDRTTIGARGPVGNQEIAFTNRLPGSDIPWMARVPPGVHSTTTEQGGQALEWFRNPFYNWGIGR